jgi:hypothetical protein
MEAMDDSSEASLPGIKLSVCIGNPAKGVELGGLIGAI